MPLIRKRNHSKKLMQRKASSKLFTKDQPMKSRGLYYATNLLIDGELIDVIFGERNEHDPLFFDTADADELLPSLGLHEYASDI